VFLYYNKKLAESLNICSITLVSNISDYVTSVFRGYISALNYIAQCCTLWHLVSILQKK